MYTIYTHTKKKEFISQKIRVHLFIGSESLDDNITKQCKEVHNIITSKFLMRRRLIHKSKH